MQQARQEGSPRPHPSATAATPDADPSTPRHHTRSRSPSPQPAAGGRASRAKAGRRYQEQRQEQESSGELFCVCQQAHTADAAMVSCDACSEWFHVRCMGLTQASARSLKRWSCPLCAALRGHLHALEEALLRTRRTRCVGAELLLP